jgi:hypothetical protein
MYSAGATFSAHLTGIAEDIFEAVSFSNAALKQKHSNEPLNYTFKAKISRFEKQLEGLLRTKINPRNQHLVFSVASIIASSSGFCNSGRKNEVKTRKTMKG